MSKALKNWNYKKEGSPSISVNFSTEVDFNEVTRKVYLVRKRVNSLHLNDDGFTKLVDGLLKQGYKQEV